MYMRYMFFFFNDTATTEIYTLSLHDALPICPCPCLLRLSFPRRLFLRRSAVPPETYRLSSAPLRTRCAAPDAESSINPATPRSAQDPSSRQRTMSSRPCRTLGSAHRPIHP